MHIINKIITLGQCLKRYDIIHPTFNDPYLIGKKSGKLVVTMHDMTHELFPEVVGDAAHHTRCNKKYIYESDHIIAVSECTKKDILKLYPDISDDKITVIYHGSSMEDIDIEGFNMKLPNNYILYVGSRESYKNFYSFVRAFERVKSQFPNLHMICSGGGAFTDQECRLFNELGLEGRYRQISSDDQELKYLYTHAKCFVYPSLYEGFGIPILEAWACNCPIALSNASCFPEIAGKAAVYFDPNNLNDIEDKIRLLLNNTKVVDEIVKEGSIRLKLFSWEKSVSKTLDVYNKILEL